MFEYLMPLLVMPTYATRCSTRPTARSWSGRSSTARARRAVGRVRVRLQQDRRAAQLPVPRVRRAGARLQARPGRRPRRRAVRQRDGADGRARSGLREPASASRPTGMLGPYGFYEAVDYTPVAPAARADRARSSARTWRTTRAWPAVARVPAARPADAAAVRVRPGCSRRPTAAAGARPAVGRRSTRIRPKCRCTRASPAERTTATARLHHAEHAGPEVHLLSNGRYHVHGHRRGRRLQPLARPRGHALAGGPDARRLGHVLLPPRRRERRVLVDAHQPTLRRPDGYEAIFSQGAREFRRRRRRRLIETTPRSASRPRTTSSSAGSAHQPRADARARSS